MSRPEVETRTGLAGVMALVYVASLPLAHLVTLRVAGTRANLSDLLLAGLILVGGASLLGGEGSRERGRGPLGATDTVALMLLVGFGAWVALSAAWGSHGSYALAKGAGLMALAAGVGILGRSRVGGGLLADAWLLGTAATLLATALMAVLGPEALRDRVLFSAGMVDGLPFPRFRGPFSHPNLFGEYLFVSGGLLWWRWPSWVEGRSRLAWALAVAIPVALFFTVSSAWLAAGAGLVTLAGLSEDRGSRVRRLLLLAGGVSLGAVTLVGALLPLSVSVLAGFSVSTGGIRPEIWASAVEAVRQAPLLGVGAAPFLAATTRAGLTADPVQYWDAHSTYLSVLGQFGPLGMVLLFGGVAVLARGILHRLRPGVVASPGAGRLRLALLAVGVGLLAHGLLIAGEDFRHAWAFLGVALAAASAAFDDPPVA